MHNIVMDATILSSLMSCERLTDFRFNQNIVPKGGKSNSLECGSIVHTFLEYYYKALIAKQSKSDAIDAGFAAAKLYISGCPVCKDLTELPACDNCKGNGNEPEAGFADSPCQICKGTGIGKLECGHKIGDFPGVYNTPEKSVKYEIGWSHALDTCLQYLARWNNDAWIPLAAEHTVGKIIYQDDEMTILWKAKLDLLVDTNSSIMPVDHKTMKQRRDSLSLNNQFMGQCVVTESRNMCVDKIGFQTSLSPKEKFERNLISYSKARLDEWQNVIVPTWAKKMVENIETNEWKPNYTHCENKYGFCAYKEICENDPNMRNEVIRINFDLGRKWDV